MSSKSVGGLIPPTILFKSISFSFNILENLFKTLDDFLIDKSYYKEVHQSLIIDYLKYYNLRPKAWWNQAMDKSIKNTILRDLVENNKLDEPLLDLYKYSVVEYDSAPV